MIALRRACRTHRAAMLDLVERGERGPATSDALDHLDTCRACEREVVGVALTVAALRRAGSAHRRLPVPPMAYPGVAAVPPAGGRWAWRLQLGSLMAGAALAAAVVMPQAGVPSGPTTPEPLEPITSVHVPESAPWQAAEFRLASSPDVGPVTVVEASAGPLPARYPDTLFRPVKEVTASDASARVLEPR